MAHLVLLDLSRFDGSRSTPCSTTRISTTYARAQSTLESDYLLLTEDYAFLDDWNVSRTPLGSKMDNSRRRGGRKAWAPRRHKTQAAIERPNNRLAKDPNYDVGAIAMTFAAIGIQFNDDSPALPHLRMDTLENIQRFQLLALKTIATLTEVARNTQGC